MLWFNPNPGISLGILGIILATIAKLRCDELRWTTSLIEENARQPWAKGTAEETDPVQFPGVKVSGLGEALKQ